MKLRVLDLFSGIGGFSLGLESTGGFVTSAFCEQGEFPRRVLAKHWPGTPIYGDVRELSGPRLEADGLGGITVICGGFPCQDLSAAGKGAGLDGARSGLWWEMRRLIGEIRPRWVIAENVPVLRSRGLDRVLGSLAEIGYDAEWHCIPAAAIGAPHPRDRIWIVAYPQSFGCGAWRQRGLTDGLAWISDAARWNAANADRAGLEVGQGERRDARPQRQAAQRNACADVWQSQWPDEPALLGVDDGVSDRVDRVFALGNSLLPQIPEAIGYAILDAEEKANAA